MTAQWEFSWLGRIAALAGALALAGCATPYEPRGLTGGWVERQISADRWVVEFYGNGHTTKDTVTGFWLHRCAELTVEKGYDYFVLLGREPQAGTFADPTATGVLEDDAMHAKGSASGAAGTIYLPSTTITTWSARGVIDMRRGLAGESDSRAYDARDVLKVLGPPVRQAHADRTNMKLPIDDLASSREERRSGPVRLDDLERLLPKQ